MEDTTILAELYTMHTNLSCKQCLIIYAEVSIELLGNTQRKLTRNLDSVTEQITKNQRRKPTGDFQTKHMTYTSKIKAHVTH